MNLKKLVKEELSGTIAKSFVAQISRFHRIQASTMFHEAAEYVKNESLKLGLKDASIEQFPADGSFKYWTYTSPVGWEVKSAELHLVEPEERLLAAFQDIPQSLHMFSNATPPEGITAELIDVDSGTKSADYQGKDVKGKFVLATGRAKLVHEQAVYKRGAVGVITDAVTYEMPNVRESLDVPDAHAYQAIWPTAEEVDKVTFGFSLSKRQGTYLRAIMKEGKAVKLNAKVDARIFSSKEELVTATIRGRSKPEEEIFLIAHLCHPKPSANDNASGSGLLLEIARTIKTLIDTHKVQPPERTIRLFWVPETLGTVAYLSHHKDVSSRFVAGINLDMVGQDQELCRSTLNLDRTPDSVPSYLNDFVFNLIEQSVKEFDAPTVFGSGSTFRYRMTAFSGGSDHAEFTEATTKVPCVMLLQWPDLYYHTSMDTIDKVSEDSLKRVGWIAAVAALTLANAAVEDAFLLAYQTASRGMVRLEEIGVEAVETLFRKKEQLKISEGRVDVAQELARTGLYYRNKIEHVVWREQEAIRSVRRLGASPELDASTDNYCRDTVVLGKSQITRLEEAFAFIGKTLGVMSPMKFEESEESKEIGKLIPRRLFKGTLNKDVLRKALTETEYDWYREIEEKDLDFDKKMGEAINFMDGKRNVHDIVKAISAEYSLTQPEHMLKFLHDLEKAKLVVLQ